MARRKPRTPSPPLTSREPSDPPGFIDEGAAAWLGERLRRLALGLTAALIAARAYWPSEHAGEADTGAGLDWVLALLLVAGLAVAASLIGGRVRLRLSWADAA